MLNSKITKVFFALSSEPRFKIYTICLNEELNMTEITKRIGFTYQMIMKHLDILEDAEMITREIRLVNGIKNVFIHSIPFQAPIYQDVYLEMKKEFEQQNLKEVHK
jgi:DNA-binding MarR family transcriptional regulator